MACPSGLRVPLSFISVLKFAVAIGKVAGGLTMVLFLFCVIVTLSVAGTPVLPTTPEDTVSVLEGTPHQVLTSGVHFLPGNVQYVYVSPSNDSIPLHSKHGCFH